MNTRLLLLVGGMRDLISEVHWPYVQSKLWDWEKFVLERDGLIALSLSLSLSSGNGGHFCAAG